MKKSVAFILTVVFIVSAVACYSGADTATAPVSETIAETQPDTDIYGREYVPSALPAGLDYDGGVVTVFLRDAASIFDTKPEFIAESENGKW